MDKVSLAQAAEFKTSKNLTEVTVETQTPFVPSKIQLCPSRSVN